MSISKVENGFKIGDFILNTDFILNNEGGLLLVLLVSVLIAFLSIIFYIRRAVLLEFKPKKSSVPKEILKKGDKANLENDEEQVKLQNKILETFNQYIYVIKKIVTRQPWRYVVPWYLMLGEKDSGKTHALESLDLRKSDSLLLKSSTFKNEGCDWSLFNKGIILDIEGKYFASQEGSSENKVWKLILRQIQKHRPKRPIDGIILTVSAEDLKPIENNLDEEILVEKGERIYRNLWEIQKKFGFIVPIYILVTHCGRLSSFEGFWRPFVSKRKSEIVGWSNPHTLDTNFSETWLDQAFVEIRDNLNRIQMEMAASTAPITDTDEFFMYPQEFEKTKEALSIYLNSIFKVTAYNESFFLRGVYFSGQLKDTPAGSRSLQTLDNKTLFINDLFAKKIFPEKNLARATAKTLISNNRIIRQLKNAAVALFVCLSLWVVWDSIKLMHDVETVNKALINIKNTLKLQDDRMQTAEENKDEQEKLFDDLENITSGSFSRIAFPASWFADLDFLTSKFFIEGFQEIVFNVMSLKLEKNSNNLGLSNEEVDVLPVKSMFENGLDGEIQSFQQLLDEVIEFENKRNIYNNWPGSAANNSDNILENMSSLVSFLLEFDLKPTFIKNSSLYSPALIEIKPIKYPDPKKYPEGKYPYRTAVIERIVKRAKRLHKLLTKEDLIYFSLSDISTSLLPYGEINTLLDQPKMVSMFVRETKNVDSLRTSPLWEGLEREGARFKYCKNLQDKIEIFKNTLVDTYAYKELNPLSKTIQSFENNQCDHKIIQKILSYKIPQFGPVLISGEKDEFAPKFNPEINGILLMLKKIGVYQFLKFNSNDYESFSLSSELPPGKILTWDTDMLNKVINTNKEYQEFIEKDLNEFPNPLKKKIKDLAHEGVLISIHDTLFDAQIYVDQANLSISLPKEATIANQISNLNKNSKLLLQVISILTQLESRDTRVFSDLIRSYAVKLIDQIDLFFQANPIYPAVANIAEWTGQSEFLDYAYQVQGKTALDNYLKTQREAVIYSSENYAQPIFSLLEKLPRSNDSVLSKTLSKWQATVSDINQYKSKNLSSDLYGLEEFFNSTLLGMTKENCLNKMSLAKKVKYSGDMFSSVWFNLYQQVNKRCQDLIEESFEKNYLLLTKKFNQFLKGKYPFIQPELNPQNIEEVDPIAIQSFYTYFDTVKKGLEEQVKIRTVNDSNYNSVLKFLQQLDGVGKFFKPTLIATSQGVSTQIKLDINFRPLPKTSVDTNQIIKWVFESGSQSIEYLKDPPKVIWGNNQNVNLKLQWAKDSPKMPLGPVRVPNGPTRVGGNNVEFMSSGKWALIKFIQSFSAPSYTVPGGRNANPHVLEMVVPLIKRVSQEGAGSNSTEADSDNKSKDNAKIYIRLALSVTDSKSGEIVNLIMPSSFPYTPPSILSLSNPIDPSIGLKQISNISTSIGDAKNTTHKKPLRVQAQLGDSTTKISIGENN